MFFIITCVLLLSGCNSENNQDNSSNGNANRTNEVSNDSAKSVDITSEGDYLVGTDIMPGSYYAVLTDIEYGAKYGDKGAVFIEVTSKENKDTSSSEDTSDEDQSFYLLKEIGEKEHIVLKDGDMLNFDGNYSPKSWEVKLLNESDFRAYMKENK